jgi:hypothetical protein
MKTYYVIYSGRGTDGGFGDYAPPYWSADPVAVNGRTIWFAHEPEAAEATVALNRAAANAFYEAGHGGSYTGDFPVEYEWRKIVAPDDAACDVDQAIELISDAHAEAWACSDWDFNGDDDEEDVND